MAEKEYYRLTRMRMRRRGFFATTRSSLWGAKDHLLLIDSTGYTEDYKRFYFRDIQALAIRQTKTRMIWNFILGAIASFFAIIGLSIGNRIGFIIFGSITGLFLLLLLVNTFLGPTCACAIRTAVQTEDLPSVNRVRKFHKILSRIRPFVSAAQGELAAGEIPARLLALSSGSFATRTSTADQTQPAADDLNPPSPTAL